MYIFVIYIVCFAVVNLLHITPHGNIVVSCVYNYNISVAVSCVGIFGVVALSLSINMVFNCVCVCVGRVDLVVVCVWSLCDI